MYYNNQWHKRWGPALLHYIRDFFIYFLPLFRLPVWLQKIVFGFKVDFIFVVHPRRSQDYYIALPFLTFFRKKIRKENFLNAIRFFPPFVLSRIKTSHGVNGLVVSGLCLPHDLIKSKGETLVEAKKVLKFCYKVGGRGCVVGLGAWWPIMTGRGKNLSGEANRLGLKLTNGHTVTILSLVKTIEKIAKISGLSVDKLNVVVVGSGKIGGQVGDILINKKVRCLGFIDVNRRRLEILATKYQGSSTEVKTHIFQVPPLKDVLKDYHIGICATSSTNKLIRAEDVPKYFIFIDDSRPEAVTRQMNCDTKIVLEGGSMKFKGLEVDYDFGMGIDENVFGCLAEAIVLAIDKGHKIVPSVDDVDIYNFNLIWEFCLNNGIQAGDFKSQHEVVKRDRIIAVLKVRDELIRR